MVGLSACWFLVCVVQVAFGYGSGKGYGYGIGNKNYYGSNSVSRRYESDTPAYGYGSSSHYGYESETPSYGYGLKSPGYRSKSPYGYGSKPHGYGSKPVSYGSKYPSYGYKTKSPYGSTYPGLEHSSHYAYSKAAYEHYKHQKVAHAYVPKKASNLHFGNKEHQEVFGCIVIRGFGLMTDLRYCISFATYRDILRFDLSEIMAFFELPAAEIDVEGCVLFDFADHYTPDMILYNNVCVDDDVQPVYCLNLKNTHLLERFHHALLSVPVGQTVVRQRDAAYYQLKRELGLTDVVPVARKGVENMDPIYFYLTYSCPQFPGIYNTVFFDEEGQEDTVSFYVVTDL